MTFIAATDLLFQAAPDRDRLRIAVSRAFGVDPGRVHVADYEDLTPIPDTAQVILRRWTNALPGDFPVDYRQTIDVTLEDRVDSAYDTVAAELGTVILTDAEEYDTLTAHLPDGSRQVLRMPEQDEGGFLITPQLRRKIDAATQSTRRAVAS